MQYSSWSPLNDGPGKASTGRKRKTTKIAVLITTSMFLLISHGTKAQAPSAKEKAPAKASQKPATTQDLNAQEYITLLGKDVRSQKAILMGAVMQLDADDSLKFWPMNGFEAAKQIREEFPDVKVAFFSVEYNLATIRAALSLRGSAYVKKTRGWTDLATASRPFCPNSPWPIAFLGSE